MKKSSINRQLARFADRLSFDKLPSDVVDMAKVLTLDALAAATAGHDHPAAKVAMESVKDSKGNATVFFDSQKLSTVDACFVNSSMIGSTTISDVVRALHPGRIIVPVTIALAEQERSSGAEAITALVAAYEVMLHIYYTTPWITPRFRCTTTCGTFGAAAATGKLLGLTEDQMVNALGYAANYSCGLTECMSSGTMEMKLHSGMVSRSGIQAALLARAGATASERTMEAEHGFFPAFAGTNKELEPVTGGLGKKFLIMDMEYKPFPFCNIMRATLDLATGLKKKHNINGKNIEKIIERVPTSSGYPAVGNDYSGPFTNTTQAIMSFQFGTAATFLERPVASPAWYEANYNDTEVAKLAAKVEVIGAQDTDVTRIEVVTKDGKKCRSEAGEFETGIPTAEKVRAKFERFGSSTLGKPRINRIADTVLNLEKIGDLRELTKLLVRRA